jgi:phosphoglycolate phosphatase
MTALDTAAALARYRLLILDFDGTLADSADWMIGMFDEVAVRHRLRRVGRDEIAMLRGKSGREVLAYLDCPLWKLPAIARDVRKASAAQAERIALFEGVPALFAALGRRGVQAAIVSSNGEPTIRRILGPGLAGQVAYWDCGASLFGKAAKFREVVRRSGVDASEVLCVGDEIRDIAAAREAGLACAAALWGYATAEALHAHAPDHAFPTVAALASALG